MRGCDADHTARAVSRLAQARGAPPRQPDTSGPGRLRALGAFVASLQSCGSIHLGDGIRRLTETNRNMGWTTATPRLLSLRGRQDRLQGLLRNGLDWRGWRPNSGQRSVSATSSIGFSMTVCGERRRVASGAFPPCGVYLSDLEQPRPPDLPPGLVRLRVVASND